MNKLKTLLHSNKFLICLCLMCCIYVYLNLTVFNKSKIDITKNNINGKIIDYYLDGNKLSLIIKAEDKVSCVYYIDAEKEKKTIAKNIKLGMTINAIGSFEKPKANTIFNSFNYQNYLKSKNINYILNIDKLTFMENKINLLYKIKNYIINRINEYEKNKDYYYTFLLGDKRYFDNNFLNSLKDNGIIHLFAISGMHINLFLTILNYILSKITKNKIVSNLCIFTFLLFYMFLTSFSASVLRASFLAIFKKINEVGNLKLSILKILIFSIISLLFISPNLIIDIGFLYSAMATLSLVLFSQKYKFKNYILNLLAITMIVNIFTLPLTLYNYYEINLLAIIWNIFFVPYVSFIVYPLTLLSFFLPMGNYLLSASTYILENLSLIFQNFSFTINFCKINILFIVLYYMFLYLIVYKQNKKSLVFIIFLLIIWKYKPYLNDNSYVYFIDVGQGDSILIRDKFNKNNILIDSGGVLEYSSKDWQKRDKSYTLADSTIAFMKSLGITKLNLMIITHGDYDHMGEAANLVNNFKVEKVIFNNGEYNELELELIKILEDKNIPYYQNIKELNMDNNKLYFLNNGLYDNENDNSNVIYFKLNNFKFLFMGDAGIEVEENLLEKYNLNDIDILKVGHHGSKTSTSKSFIDKINPKYSIISVGKNNIYSHPNNNVLENLEDSKVYRTDQDGSIMFKIRNDNLKIETCTP